MNTGDDISGGVKAPPPRTAPSAGRLLPFRGDWPAWVTYPFAAAVTVATLFVRTGLGAGFGDRPLLILFIFPIILSAYVGGVGPGLLSTILAAAITDYFLIPPAGTFYMERTYDLTQWLLFILNGAIISLLIGALRRSRASAEIRTVDFIRANRDLEEEISERNRAEAALKETNQELERFTYMISHDLKSPLITIKTFLGYLEKDAASGNPERIGQDILFIDNAAEKMGLLLDDLLEFSRIGRISSPPETITFREVVDEALKLTAGAIKERGVRIVVTDADTGLSGDRPRFVEIWQNLLENAVKYMGNQGSPLIEIGMEGSGRDTLFSVRDNGMGIEPKELERIFGIFVKLDPKSDGTGLGLALVRRIIELYRGEIRAESDGPGQGASFRFTLPDAVDPPGEGR